MQQTETLPTAATASTTGYDAVIVSTSPVCLMTAIALRAQGKRVLLVDQRPIVGGAWITTNLAGFENVEVGCHLIDPDPVVYQFMLDLGIPMMPLSPKPLVVSRDAKYGFPKRIPYAHRWLRDLFDIVARPEPSPFVEVRPDASLKDQLKNAYRVFRHGFHALKGDTSAILYPLGGCNVITTRLAELVSLSGVEVRTSTRLEDVSVDTATGTVTLTLNGEAVTTRSAYLTASVSLPVIKRDDEVVPLDAQQHTFQNLYLVVKDPGPLDLSYNLYYGDHVVHRVSDLTRFARRTGAIADDAVIVGLTVDENRTEDREFASECLERLKEYRVVAQEASLVDFCFLPYKFTWLDIARRRSLKSDLAPYVRIIDSESMTRSIKNLIRDEDIEPVLAFAAQHPFDGASTSATSAA